MENPAPKDATWQVSEVPPGSSQDRGMCEEKRTDDRPAEGGTLNSGRLAPPPSEEIYLQRINVFQPQEGIAKGAQESDLPIVVRDGNTDHTAKDQAGMQRGQSTHVARGTNILDPDVSRTLSALGTKAAKDPKHRFRSLARLLDRQMLREAFRRLKRRAAPGIDGVTHGEYAENLEENLLELESRLKQGTYRAQPVKRRWIAKAGSSKLRPLGIPVLEDKIVQQAVRMILEPIWENDFVDESIGYRPGRSPRQGTQELSEALDNGKHRWVVEADIRGFFDHINHDWLVRMLEERIADRSLIRIIRKWLKAGVMEELQHWSPSYEGTPQGGVISPLLGNIYLHFVQDLWIKSRRNPKNRQVKRSTNAKKFRAGLAALKEWLKKARSTPLPELIATLKSKLQGHWNYYGVIGNSKRTGAFAHYARWLVYKWLNRRSQRKSFTVKSFTEAWMRWKIPMPRVIEKPLPQTARHSQPRTV